MTIPSLPDLLRSALTWVQNSLVTKTKLKYELDTANTTIDERNQTILENLATIKNLHEQFGTSPNALLEAKKALAAAQQDNIDAHTQAAEAVARAKVLQGTLDAANDAAAALAEVISAHPDVPITVDPVTLEQTPVIEPVGNETPPVSTDTPSMVAPSSEAPAPVIPSAVESSDEVDFTANDVVTKDAPVPEA